MKRRSAPLNRPSKLGKDFIFISAVVCYVRCQKRRTLLRKGHVAYSVYFVFSGAVSVDFDPDDHSIFSQKKLVTLRKGAVFGVSRDSCG